MRTGVDQYRGRFEQVGHLRGIDTQDTGPA